MQKLLLTIVCITLACAAHASDVIVKYPAVPRSVPKLLEGKIQETAFNGGKVYYRDLEDKGGGQNIALWIADETRTVKGIFLSLHTGSEAWRTDLHAWARAHDFAVMGTLIRWDGYEKVLPDQLLKLGEAAGHEEVVNVPWVVNGISRNVGALLQYRLLDPNEDRILCFLFGGGPGTGVRIGDEAKLRPFRHIPILTVNGSEDPFVGNMEWQYKVYPRIAKAKMPYTVAVDWGGGHAPQKPNAMYWPFVEAVMEVRYPKDANPRAGIVKLKPFPYEDGWLFSPIDFKKQFGKHLTRVRNFEGDPAQAVWFPDEHSAHVWNAYHAKPDGLVLTAEPADAGKGVALSIQWQGEGEPPTVHGAVFQEGRRNIGKVDGDVGARHVTERLSSGVHVVHARVQLATGAAYQLQPIVIASGKQVRAAEGHRAAQNAELPINVAALSGFSLATLRTIDERRQAADTWKLVFEDNFEDGMHSAWYDYYDPPLGKSKRRKGHEDDKREVVDGAMQLYSKLHAVAMLPYDWPDDVKIEYKAKAVSDRVCDMSVVLSGNPGGTDFPWREGMMYQFGAHFNQGSFFIIFEQPHKDWQPYDSGARITPGKWHHLVVERLDNTAKAFVDGELKNTRELKPSDYERFYARKIGLYTFQSTAQFDDVKIYVRTLSEEAELTAPPMPDSDRLDLLAHGLIDLSRNSFAVQRNAARKLMERYSYELGPSLHRLLEAGKVPDEATPWVRRMLSGRRPG